MTLIFQSCTDSGGGGKKGKSLVSPSINASTVDSTISTGEKDSGDESSEEEFSQIISKLDNESLEQINTVIESMDEEEVFVSIKKIDTHYNLQNLRVKNFGGSPIGHIINYHSEGSKIFRYNVDTENIDILSSSNKLKIKNIFQFDGNEYFLTQRPVKLYKLNLQNNNYEEISQIFSDNKESMKSSTLLGANLCILSNKSNIHYLNLTTNISETRSSNKKIQKAFCNESLTVIQHKEDGISKIESISSDNSSVLAQKEEGSKIALYQRGSSLYYRISLLKNESRPQTTHQHYEAFSNQPASSIEKAAENFNYIKSYINTYDTNLDNPSFKLIVMNSKLKEKIFEQNISSALERENLFEKFFQTDGELYLTSRSQRTLYKLSNNSFEKLGNPHGLRLQSLFMHDNKLHLSAGKYVYAYDPANEWTVGKEDYLSVKREDISHNPQMVKKLKSSVHHAFSHNNEINFLKHLAKKQGSILLNSNEEVIQKTSEGIQLRHIQDDSLYTTSVNKEVSEQAFIFDQNEISIDGENRINRLIKWSEERYISISKNIVYEINNQGAKKKLLTLAGKKSYNLIKTPNDKLLLMNDSNIILFNPNNLSTETIYELNMDQLKNLRSMVLQDNKLFLIDKSFKLHLLSIPAHKLSLFDQES